MKYFLSIAISILSVSSAMAFCVSAQDYSPLSSRYEHGLLFAARDCNENSKKTHFIFGTYHSDKQAVIKTASMAFASLKQVQSAVFEIKIDPHIQAKTLAAIMLPTSSPNLEELIGKELYNKLLAASKTHGDIPEQILPRLHIWAATILLQYPKPESSGIVLDMALQQHAEILGVKTQGLETIEEQFSIFQGLSSKQQLYFLNHTLDTLDDLDVMLHQITADYIAQDLKKIEQLSRKAFDALPDKQLATYLEEALITKRNMRMAERLIPIFRKNTTFVGVGALHLPGSTGIFHLLEQKGFQIQPVPIDP